MSLGECIVIVGMGLVVCLVANNCRLVLNQNTALFERFYPTERRSKYMKNYSQQIHMPYKLMSIPVTFLYFILSPSSNIVNMYYTVTVITTTVLLFIIIDSASLLQKR